MAFRQDKKKGLAHFVETMPAPSGIEGHDAPGLFVCIEYRGPALYSTYLDQAGGITVTLIRIRTERVKDVLQSNVLGLY